MKKILGLFVITVALFSCNKTKKCYDCKSVWSEKTETGQNSSIAQTGLSEEEFCGSEDEVMQYESDNSYEGEVTIKSTSCILQN